jgi:type II secretory pathway pseudopilin PulG
VVFIIGLLISLLLPAVQSARETARRVQCQSHLQQIGLALRNYETTHNVLPPGTVEPSGPVANTPLGFHHSWTVAILPWLDPPSAAEVRYDLGVYSPPNLSVLVNLGRTPQVFSCPSDSSFFRECDYAGCHDDRDKPIDEDDNGVFFRNSAVRSKDIPDGTAHTFFVGEKLFYPPEWGWMSGTRATLRTAGIPIIQTLQSRSRSGYDDEYYDYQNTGPRNVEELARTVRPDLFASDGQDWQDWSVESEDIRTKMLKGPETPQDPQIIEELRKLGEIPEGMPIIGGFGSEHPGVTNFLFGDISVRTIRHQIDPKVFCSLGNRADGEGIDESF